MLLSHCHRFRFLIKILISITCCNSFSFSSLQVVQPLHDSEIQVLLKLKQQWHTSPSVQSWNISVPFCNKLRGIYCTNNFITGFSLQYITKIPAVICDLPNLTFLNLSYNYMPGEFPTVLYKCSKLQTLDLSFNDFHGPVPTDIYKLSNLEHLDIGSNSFIGDIPSSIGQLTKLTYLDFGHNSFNGTFPSEIANLKNLEMLSIGLNPLIVSRSIPKEFTRLKKLKYLRMSFCNLFGSIPASFANFSNLMELDLSSNNLVGDIPSGIFQIKNLTILHLYDNQLSGEISMIIEALNLVDVDLSRNMLTGPIPSDLGKLQKLETLYLYGNQLSGPIPTSFANLSSLKNLHMYCNKLVGLIPENLGKLQRLESLDLHGNILSGPIPNSLANFSCLKDLDLSSNKLVGSIPSGLFLQKHLTFVYLDQNQLSGEIPMTIPRYFGHIYLDLSSNHLRGKIPSVFEDAAYNTSFLNNSKLCSNNKILNVPTCSYLHKYIILITAIGGSVFTLTVFVTIFFKVLGDGKDNQSSEQLTWEVKAFHKLAFAATDIVSCLIEDNMIGSGGSGKVYRIDLNDASDKVAVKKILNNTKSKDSLEKQFLAEIEILGMIRHANIVKLLCCISSEDSKLLVYEYLENGNLYNWLHGGQESSMSLDWPTRLHIAIGAAKGLSYMHHGCFSPIIHRDVKSSNILLDTEFNAKIADFGLAKISISRTGEPYTASAIAGTFGYMAPEYTSTRRLNEKIDVYSFGVVLLELCTGKEPRRVNDCMNLVEWSQRHYSEGHPIGDALDIHINKETRYLEEMKDMFKLGVMCTRVIPSARPSMRQVSELLISFYKSEPHDTSSTESGEETTTIDMS